MHPFQTCAFIEAMVQGGVSLDLGWDEALKVASAVVSVIVPTSRTDADWHIMSNIIK